jgi:hypothetical protein
MARKRHVGRRDPRNSNELAFRSVVRTHRFGGRATAAGVGYESRLAALIAAQMLAGEGEYIWDWAPADEITSITLQVRGPVDDIIIERGGEIVTKAFVQAKDWGKAVAPSPTDKTFAKTIASFVEQYLGFAETSRCSCALVWAVSSTMGKALTQDLQAVLDAFRKNSPDQPLQEFIHNRSNSQQKVMVALGKVLSAAWRKIEKKMPNEEDLQTFFRSLRIEIHDFGRGRRNERTAMRIIRQNIVAKPSDAEKVWEKLENIFAKVNEVGLNVTPASLRHELISYGFALKVPPTYAPDIEILKDLSQQNLVRLRDHSLLQFSRSHATALHVSRPAEERDFVFAAKAGHRLLTGEPGCGKSGLMYVTATTLLAENVPVVVLLAEDVFPFGQATTGNILGLAHKLDDVLAHWPSDERGILLTDALDAVRDAAASKMLRSLLHQVLLGRSGWRVVASVREFDLKYGHELKELFPGEGFPGYQNNDFAGVSHFHLGGLRDSEIDWLVSQRPQIHQFVETANQNPKSGGLQRSLFYLRLAAELLGSGVNPARLADWSSPALLLRSFWERRLETTDEAAEDSTVLQKICERMVAAKNPTISSKEIVLAAADRKAIRCLRSKGLLQGPATRYGQAVGEEAIRFSHHLLHDYAIAKTLIPALPDQFCSFAEQNPLLPVFYRQSFLFALEEMWDADPRRESYWVASLRLQSIPALHGVTRIMAPILAARRVENIDDLTPLLNRVQATATTDSAESSIALRHLASGLQDADAEAIRVGADAWATFANQLAQLLDTHVGVEAPLVHLLARLSAVGIATVPTLKLQLNRCGRALLAFHLKRPVNSGWIYLAIIAIETVCQTFESAPNESETMLLALMKDERVAQFPQEELFRFALQIQHLGVRGARVILRLFECAFGIQPEPGQWQNFGTMILPLRIQSRDQWHSIQHVLADFYVKLEAENVILTTRAACIVSNSRAGSLDGMRGHREPLSTITFRGKQCTLISDGSFHMGRRPYSMHPDEDRIIAHFEKLLGQWAENGNTETIDTMLDAFVQENKTAMFWAILFDAGAAHPQAFGQRFLPVVNETTFFTCSDYAYSAIRLFEVLHRDGDETVRRQLEQVVTSLPAVAPLREDETRAPVPTRLEYAQNRLLGALKEENIASPEIRALFLKQNAANALIQNTPPRGIEVFSHQYSEEELAQQRGINLQDRVNQRIRDLGKSLNDAFPDNEAGLNSRKAASKWRIVLEGQRIANRYQHSHKVAVMELWDHLITACRNILVRATWPASSGRWLTIRKIVLAAAANKLPEGDDRNVDADASWPSWGFPSPRLYVAQALPMVVHRQRHADKNVEAALWKLSRDPAYEVRFHFAENLTPLWQFTPELMWAIMDSIIKNERIFGVLEKLISSLDWLLHKDATKALQRLAAIAQRTKASSPDNHIHQQLSVTQAFHFFRTGNHDSENYLNSLVEACDTEGVYNALSPVLHNCRGGGWLVVEQTGQSGFRAEAVRSRVWAFMLKLATVAQEKAENRMKRWKEHGPFEGEALKEHEAGLGAALKILDGIASQLYFLSGAFEQRAPSNPPEVRLNPVQLGRFWGEAEPVFRVLAEGKHPHTAYELVQTLNHLLPLAPRNAFLLAMRCIRNSASVGFHREPMAVPEVVKLIQHALADHRDIFQVNQDANSECLRALLAVLDIFVEASWPQARHLTHRLEEIYR